MKKNVGKTDMIVRLIIAIVILGLYFGGAVSGTLGIVLLVVAAIAILTGLISICPLYSILGMSTRSKKE